ncbi:3-keto sterol reductase [Favolaschia claudopus]|uniref:3-keto sterol reductase n=1 Tax=Favolaschia claudopus TaxID=2862362 RepID=A0AAW0AKI1_9AGAR
MDQRKSIRPVVIVTGANRGIGFGICQRLLSQLCSPSPSDSAPNARPTAGPAWSFWQGCDGFTLIMCSRTLDSGLTAREQLLKHLDHRISRLGLSSHAERATTFRRNLTVEVVAMDLTKASSLLEFAAWVQERYSYVSHLILNAGVAQFVGVKAWPAMKQVFTRPSSAVKSPQYLKERTGATTDDGIGLIWQTNVLGHYVLFQLLGNLLRECLNTQGITSRVIWMSSLSTFIDPGDYNSKDIQLLKSSHPYQDSKFQIEILAATLNQQKAPGSDSALHFVVEPGIVATGLDQFNNRGFWRVLRTLTFISARLINSHSFPTSTYDAAISVTHAALLDVESLDKRLNEDNQRPQLKFHSRAPLNRKAYVSYEECLELDKLNAARSEQILAACDECYKSFLPVHIQSE